MLDRNCAILMDSIKYLLWLWIYLKKASVQKLKETGGSRYIH